MPHQSTAQSTYRAPPIAFLNENIATTISQQIGAIRIPFDSTGNPDLKPETSDNFNVGAILEVGGFSATLDYWKFGLPLSILVVLAGVPLIAWVWELKPA